MSVIYRLTINFDVPEGTELKITCPFVTGAIEDVGQKVVKSELCENIHELYSNWV